MLQNRVQELEKSKKESSDLIEDWMKNAIQVEVAAREMIESLKRELKEKTNEIQGHELREDALYKEIAKLLVSNTKVEKEKEFLKHDVQKLVANTARLRNRNTALDWEVDNLKYENIHLKMDIEAWRIEANYWENAMEEMNDYTYE